MKLTFEPNLDYQLRAINAVVNLFESQPKDDDGLTITLIDKDESQLFREINAIANRLTISEEQIFENLIKVQQTNEIQPLIKKEEFNKNGLNFTVEMETGTGKTYVYLRTIYELNKKYGFKKFVIVVPSIAIREGVLKNLEITFEHFQNLYDNVPVNYYVYESGKVSILRTFATNNNIEILVINIDSFAKDENIINRPNDKLSGHEPIKFIQASQPIVIVDEPQNMETEKRKSAIASLNPLCTLRYSATHRNLYNLVYSLNPIKAYDLGLVKQIEVDSVVEENAYNDAYIAVEEIKSQKTKVTAKLSIHVDDKDGVKKKSITVKVGNDLYQLSGNRDVYKGYVIEEIDVTNQTITFTNGNALSKGSSQGGLTDEIMRFQIKRTIEEHLNKELKLYKQGIKILSLFFIDRVANYRYYDEQGNTQKGKIAKWFEDVYLEYINKPQFAKLRKIFHNGSIDIDKIHNGYFSQDKKGRLKDTRGESEDDLNTYDLIMKDKEKLLGIENPLRFIFSHTALREGWDNPNVFQICTLNETKSEIKKRQEIGRGLRLAVNQDGFRIYDKNINKLTVVANESYEIFAKQLQSEIEEDCGVSFEGRIKNKRKRIAIKYRKGFEVDPKFLEIWEKVKHKTRYSVEYNTQELIEKSSKTISELPQTPSPALRSTRFKIDITNKGIDMRLVIDRQEMYGNEHCWILPDIIDYIQQKTELTRLTIVEILNKAGKWQYLSTNPQYFIDQCVAIIKKTLSELMVDGIKYEKIGNKYYEMKLFEEQELETYLDNLTFKVSNKEKTIYEEYIPLDSQVESQFAKDCESSEQIEFYFKLPSWFKIPTPIGSYNPDWAVIFKNEKKIYFVAETKDTGGDNVDTSQLLPDEQIKIKCGKKHYQIFKDVEYKVVKSVRELS
ncbi:MAG TPA: DEAD/DEAH box helicase family protein [Victivallales bacterium]|nr:DEAD/DEAH box helicase family protein [Victivallales bacterium]HRR28453.1 DEAD/DEAH box helicase family protein [Victivallales bacterium]